MIWVFTAMVTRPLLDRGRTQGLFHQVEGKLAGFAMINSFREIEEATDHTRWLSFS